MNQSATVNTTFLISNAVKKSPRKEAVGSYFQIYFLNSYLQLLHVGVPFAAASCWQLNITWDQNLLCIYS